MVRSRRDEEKSGRKREWESEDCFERKRSIRVLFDEKEYNEYIFIINN